MIRPKTLSAFNTVERQKAHALLATRVAFMMGRKFEENDWADVYCGAKGIEKKGWSNLDIDISHGSLGVEHKMLHAKSTGDLSEACGNTFMHPSATRSIRVPATTTDPDEAARDVLTQYGDLIRTRSQKVKELSGTDTPPDMRIGWLLWQSTLRQFLYFEQEMLIPNPDDYRAQWVSKVSKGARKGSTNLWIFEKGDRGTKRYSVTSEAGAKIQPYFDVPPITDPNLYIFTVIGEMLDTGLVRVWITESTKRELTHILGSLDTEILSKTILESAQKIVKKDPTEADTSESASPYNITKEAYLVLQGSLPGVNDTHSFQLLAEHLRGA